MRYGSLEQTTSPVQQKHPQLCGLHLNLPHTTLINVAVAASAGILGRDEWMRLTKPPFPPPPTHNPHNGPVTQCQLSVVQLGWRKLGCGHGDRILQLQVGFIQQQNEHYQLRVAELRQRETADQRQTRFHAQHSPCVMLLWTTVRQQPSED
ncbi:hypothetical protein SprV_0802614900 [Sparganum proliferum]